MFDMEIMNDAETQIAMGWSIDILNRYIFREGYEVIEKEEVAERVVEGEETFELSNGWVVVGLR